MQTWASVCTATTRSQEFGPTCRLPGLMLLEIATWCTVHVTVCNLTACFAWRLDLALVCSDMLQVEGYVHACHFPHLCACRCWSFITTLKSGRLVKRMRRSVLLAPICSTFSGEFVCMPLRLLPVHVLCYMSWQRCLFAALNSQYPVSGMSGLPCIWQSCCNFYEPFCSPFGC